MYGWLLSGSYNQTTMAASSSSTICGPSCPCPCPLPSTQFHRGPIQWRLRAAPLTSPTTSSIHFSREIFESFLLSTQESICTQLASVDGSGKQFCKDEWMRGDDPANGYGITRVLEDGDVMEKAAANISIIRGCLTEARAKAISARGRNIEAGSEYFAGALSLVFHPKHPYIPTFRADVRYFEVGGLGWFGGGADLTPNYLDIGDACQFHGFLKQLCDKYDSTLYTSAKVTCDSYFYLPARREHRGIGGIFFDDLEYLNPQPESTISGQDSPARKSAVFKFVADLGQGFLPSYLPIIEKNRTLPYTERERQWQLLRRGRYLEFNLLYDRGVKFGLDGGRIESIMVSAPPMIAWKYNVTPENGSPEAEMLEVLQNPRAWT